MAVWNRPAPATAKARKTALVIDPTDDVKAMLPNVLKPIEWKTDYAPDNDSALEMIHKKPFDIVLSSEKGSGLEDVEVLRKIRSIRPHTRMIILTTQSTPQLAIEAMREHAFSYFKLPCSTDGLEEMVRIAMANEVWDDGIDLVAATPEWIRLHARCDLATADRLTQFVFEMTDGIPLEDRKQLGLAFREMLLNAIEHGGKFNPNEHVEISYLRTKRSVACRISDPGTGFRLEDIPHSAISNRPDSPFDHLEHRQIQGLRPGGYGIMMARELVDDLIYSEDGNEVVMVKYLDKHHNKPH